MARIKIKDLPKDMKISKKEMKQVIGGLTPGHAYTVLGTYTVDGNEYVVTRNPWGTAEPDSGGTKYNLTTMEETPTSMSAVDSTPTIRKK